MINITKFDIVTLCATLSEENNVFENNIYLHFVYTIEVFLKQLVTGHPVLCSATDKCFHMSRASQFELITLQQHILGH